MTMSESSNFAVEYEKKTGRTEAFSDGVFAIAMTLLALEVSPPSHEATESAGGLAQALLDGWPGYIAFVISFLTTLIMWANHHHLLKLFKRTDHVFRILNGLTLMGISLVPFTSALLADYISDSENARIAAMVYAGVFAFIALCWNVLWFYGAYRGHLLKPDVPQALIDSINRTYLVSPLLYLTALLLALIHVALSVTVVAGLAIFYLFPRSSGENATN